MFKNSQKGITLVEFAITLGIFVIITFAIYGFIRIALLAQSRSLSEITAGNDARKAILQMAHDIRGTIQSETGGYPIEEATDQSLIIYTNVDDDEDTERVRYTLSGTNLERGIIQPQGAPATYPLDQEQVSILSQYIQNDASPIFYYYDENYTGTQDPINPEDIGMIRLIKINLMIDTNPNSEPEALDIETEVQLRNLKDNL